MLVYWATVVFSFVQFVVAAKVHGRQLRLERELEGYWEVQFGTGKNPPWVETLWRRDRIRFWVLAPSYGLLFGAYVSLGHHWGLPIPSFGDPGLGILLVVVLLWAPTATFLTLALASYRRFTRALKRPASPGAPPRREAARRQHPGWWTAASREGTFWWGLLGALTGGVLSLAYV